jgi:hypothetical protein
MPQDSLDADLLASLLDCSSPDELLAPPPAPDFNDFDFAAVLFVLTY